MLLVMQFTARFAAFFSILAVVGISALRRDTRMGLEDIIAAPELGARPTISTAITPPVALAAYVGAGGTVAVFCMATLGERFLIRVLPYWKLGLLAAGIVLILAPGHLSHALAILCAAAVLVSEWRNRRLDPATLIGERKLP